MHCLNCGAPGHPGANFCVLCGSRLPTACANCRAVNPADSRFCRNCGAALSAGGLAAPPPVQDVICPRCRAASQPGAPFCHACGLPLDEDGGRTGMRSAPRGRPAGFWIRAVAAIIDVLCLTAAQFLLIVIAPEVPLDIYLTSGAIWGTGAWVDFAALLIGIAYYTVGVSVWATTIGKRAVGIYVLRPDGSKLGPGRAFARYWAHTLSALILFAGFLMVAFRRDKRALHDLICDTVVVYGRG